VLYKSSGSFLFEATLNVKKPPTADAQMKRSKLMRGSISKNKRMFRRSPFLVLYWQGEQLVFENFATGKRVTAAPITCEILNFFSQWRPASWLYSRCRQFSPSSIDSAIATLAQQSLLERSDTRLTLAEKNMRTWEHWNPAAGFFHFSTKIAEVEEDDSSTTYKRLVRLAKRIPMPLPVKRYRGARKMSLVAPKMEGEFPNVLFSRRTWRRFSPRPLLLADLATLLGLTWRIQRWERVPKLGRAALKTSPSGGALHPIEAYVLARNVKGIQPGLYHYAAERHCLELLREGATTRQVARYLCGQKWYQSAAALVIMTAVFSRTQWKYDNARFYRAVLIEAGHLCQTFCLVASWLGLAPFCSMALADAEIEEALQLDGVTESVVYAAGVGTRPKGVEWAPAPSRRDAPWWPK
jgi:SagB-type dehydrogenase family enzyme